MDNDFNKVYLPLQKGNIVYALEALEGKYNNYADKELFKKINIPLFIKSCNEFGVKEKERELIQSFLERIGYNMDYDIKITPFQNVISGTVNGLFVYDGKITFGCVHTITVSVIKDGKSELKCTVANSRIINDAIQIVYQALRHFLSKFGLNPNGITELSKYSFNVQVGNLGEEYDGASLGVAVFCAMLSALIDVPISSKYAFTGELRNNGAIMGVVGIEHKIKVAISKGMEKIFIPKANKSDSSSKEVLAYDNIFSLVENLFEKDKIREFVQKLNSNSYINEIDSQTENKVLISVVGKRDPYGTNNEEGAILTAFRRVSPEKTFLFYTCDKEGKTSTKVNAEETKSILDKLIEGEDKKSVHIIPLMIDDPTDYEEIVQALEGGINLIKNQLNNADIYLSISSGTPQMHAVWIHLNKNLKAHILQVRESKFVKEGEDRVRIVKSPTLGLV